MTLAKPIKHMFRTYFSSNSIEIMLFFKKMRSVLGTLKCPLICFSDIIFFAVCNINVCECKRSAVSKIKVQRVFVSQRNNQF